MTAHEAFILTHKSIGKFQGNREQTNEAAMTKIISGVFGGYIAIGVILYLVQSFGGQPCNTLLGEKYLVRRENLVFAVAMWLPDFIHHVGSGNTSLQEYLAPTRCAAK